MPTTLHALLVLTAVTAGSDFYARPLQHVYRKWEPRPVVGDVGSRMILTPYLEAGNISGAQDASRVSGDPFPEDIPSYSGFFTVNKTYNSNLFFWFFPAKQNYETAPVVLWLQGGPGSSSLYGLFTELGPFTVAEDDTTLVPNPYSWHNNYSLIFIDNPVGTGFSFTDYDEGYATNQVQVGSDLYSAMIQFFTMFPELQQLPFFVTGESYAGKYVPALGYTIYQRNASADLKINLQGLAVGNGFTDPVTTLDHSQFVHQLGLVDTKAYNTMKEYEDFGRDLVQQGNLIDAFNVMNFVLGLFYEHSHLNNIYNFLYENEPQVGGDYYTFVQSEEVRRLIHVGDATYSNGGTVYDKMVPDFMNSLRPWLEQLLEHYRVLYYSGQMDVIMAYPLSVNMYNSFEFSASEEYRNATRVPWYVDGELAGYIKSAGKFTEVLVRNAGHMVPADQAKWALQLISRFIDDNLVAP